MKKISKFKAEQLSTMMLTIAYPILIDLMWHTGLQRSEFLIKGFCPIYIDVEENYYWDTGNGVQTGLVTNLLEQTVDPELNDVNNSSCPGFPFKLDAYYLWCEMVMDRIDELKSQLPKVYKLIDRLNKIPIVYDREVLIEKT